MEDPHYFAILLAQISYQIFQWTSSSPRCRSEHPLEEISFTVYPNPADQVITISLPDEIREDATLSIYNSVGQIIYSVSPENNDNAITINISSWPAGLYLVILNDNTGMMVQKFR